MATPNAGSGGAPSAPVVAAPAPVAEPRAANSPVRRIATAAATSLRTVRRKLAPSRKPEVAFWAGLAGENPGGSQLSERAIWHGLFERLLKALGAPFQRAIDRARAPEAPVLPVLAQSAAARPRAQQPDMRLPIVGSAVVRRAPRSVASSRPGLMHPADGWSAQRGPEHRFSQRSEGAPTRNAPVQTHPGAMDLPSPAPWPGVAAQPSLRPVRSGVS